MLKKWSLSLFCLLPISLDYPPPPHPSASVKALALVKWRKAWQGDINAAFCIKVPTGYGRFRKEAGSALCWDH